MIVDFSGVLHAFNVNSFRERRIFFCSGNNFGLWCGTTRRKREENCEGRTEKKTRHRELDAKSLEKVGEEKR
jgi:hypothetical protein